MLKEVYGKNIFCLTLNNAWLIKVEIKDVLQFASLDSKQVQMSIYRNCDCHVVVLCLLFT